jgi:hypothetical protein
LILSVPAHAGAVCLVAQPAMPAAAEHAESLRKSRLFIMLILYLCLILPSLENMGNCTIQKPVWAKKIACCIRPSRA